MKLEISVQRGHYRRYHSDLKKFVASGGNIALALDIGIPPSTANSWKYMDFSKYINHPVTGSSEKDFKIFQKFIKNTFAQKIFSVYDFP